MTAPRLCMLACLALVSERAWATDHHRDPATDAFLAGAAAYRSGRLSEAAGHFHRAGQLDPGDSDAVWMEGLAQFRLGQMPAARLLLAQALRMNLAPEDRRLAEEYLRVATAAARDGEVAFSPRLLTAVGVGWDSNVRQAALADRDYAGTTESGPAPSGFASAWLSGGMSHPLGSRVATEVDYTFLQIAYPAPEHQSFSIQDHVLDWRNEARLGLLRPAVVLRGELAFSGLGASYATVERAVTVEPQLAVAWPSRARTRLSLGYSARQAPVALAHLSGRRLDAKASQELLLSGWCLLGGYHHRRMQAGLASYAAHALVARVASPSRQLVRLALAGRFESRTYSSAYQDRRVRAGADVRFGRRWSLATRYEALANLSSTEASYLKHLLMLELETSWF